MILLTEKEVLDFTANKSPEFIPSKLIDRGSLLRVVVNRPGIDRK